MSNQIPEVMEAKWTTSRNASRLFLLMAVILTLSCTSCSENPTWNPAEEKVPYLSESNTKEYFKAYPSGSTIHAFDGNVILHFPAGTVPTTTRFEIVSFAIDHLDLKGKNVMMRAISLKNVTNKNRFEKDVTLLMRYDLCGYSMCEPGEESELAIFRYIGDRYYAHKFEALGNCIMNCSCKTVRACIDECGTFTVVEK